MVFLEYGAEAGFFGPLVAFGCGKKKASQSLPCRWGIIIAGIIETSLWSTAQEMTLYAGQHLSELYKGDKPFSNLVSIKRKR